MIFGPLGGGADIDEMINEYCNFNINDGPQVKKIILKERKLY